jgi:DNA replication protein DnaC
MQLVKQRLRNFKLSGIYHNLEERVSYAQEKSLSYSEFLGLLLEDEENNRRTNSYKKRYSRAKLPAHKNIEDFDFSFQPSIDKRTINDCLTCILSLSVTPVPASPISLLLLVLRL